MRPAALAFLLASASVGASPITAQERPVDSTTGAWLGAGALLAGSLLFDQGFHAAAPEAGERRWKPFTDQLNHLGNPRFLVPALAASYAGGKLASAPGVASSSVHVLGALLAAGVANGTIKYSVGRERPAGGDPFAFRPFSSSNRWQSFPSGHAVVAFSVAAAVSEEAGRGWVSALSYGTASLVGWSRVYTDKHWTSDVVGGAVIGAASSRAALHLLHRRLPHQGLSEESEAGASAPASILVTPAGLEVRFATW